MSNLWILVILGVASYLLGNVNWSILFSKFKKQDIRQMGSGNPGTLNMSRNFGIKVGLLIFLLDIMKGVLPTLVAFLVLKDRGNFTNSEFAVFEFGMYLCGFCAVLGHIYPVFLKFKGGKGIASTIGVFLTCTSINGWPWAMVAVMALVAAAVFIYFTEFGAMGSFIAITPPAIASCIRLYILYAKSDKLTLTFYVITSMLIFAICLFTWFAHRKNIERMLSGDEHPTSIREMVVKMKAKKAEKKAQENGVETK